MEIELKLLIDPSNVAAFRHYPLLKHYAIGQPRRQRLASIYFDTPDFEFRKHNVGLRVRKAGRKWVQTLKDGQQAEAGLHRRREWESEVSGPQPDLAVLRDQVGAGSNLVERLIDRVQADQLVPVFTVQVWRTTWQLRSRQDDEVELVLDEGELQSEMRHTPNTVPVSEIELELKLGKPGCLFEFALALQSAVPVRVGNMSKAERGYALCLPQSPPVHKATALELSATLSVGQSFQAIIGNCLKQIQGNEEGVVQGSDPESVHQMRVGVRRLRSAVGIFGEFSPCPPELKTELAWLATVLGDARDWEVFANETLAEIAGQHTGQHELALLQGASASVARKKRRNAALAIESSRYARLQLLLGAWMHSPCEPESFAESGPEALPVSIVAFAERVLAHYNEKLLKRGKALQTSRHGNPEELHEVRIAAKKARYATEFFHSLYASKRIKSYIEELGSLQDTLGRLNDTAVAEQLLRQAVTFFPDMDHAGRIAGKYIRANSGREIHGFGKRWSRFESVELPGIREADF